MSLIPTEEIARRLGTSVNALEMKRSRGQWPSLFPATKQYWGPANMERLVLCYDEGVVQALRDDAVLAAAKRTIEGKVKDKDQVRCGVWLIRNGFVDAGAKLIEKGIPHEAS